jgi:hypothetical protein
MLREGPLGYEGKIKGGRNQHQPTRTNKDKGFSAMLLVLFGSFRLEFQHKTSTVLAT